MLKSGYLFTFVLVLFTLTACQPDGTPSDPGTASTAATSDASSFVPNGYALVWADEFTTDGAPSSDNWGFQSGGFGWLAEEKQFYTKGEPGNVVQENGNLKITLRKEQRQSNPYTSTRIVTNDLHDFTYGYFEVRAKFPAGKGLRSAIWMVGDTVSKIGWPHAGEIDLVEHYGENPGAVNFAIQHLGRAWSEGGQKGAGVAVPTAETEFHVYGCRWTENRLELSVDGKVGFVYDQPNPYTLGTWPFQWPFYLAINLSAGGRRGPGGEVDESALPADLLVDYVRVYQQQ